MQTPRRVDYWAAAGEFIFENSKQTAKGDGHVFARKPFATL
jgi:hypothetical protein